MIALLAAALLPTPALAADSPSIWAREAIAAAGFPSGALNNTIVELRTPLHRSESRLFQSTYAGVGAQVLLTPAFVSVGPRVSIAPIDVFDINLKAARGWYFGNKYGLLPFDQLAGTLEDDRYAREAENFASEMWVFSAEPTLKAKVWKIVVFDSWTIDYIMLDKPPGEAAPYAYEPYRDLVIAWDEFSFEHQAGVLFEAMPGGDKPSLRLGPTYRDRFTLNSEDRSAALGLLVAAKPGTKPVIPTIVGMALWYLIDTDRVGPIPFMALQARWEIDEPLSKKKTP